jgi:hypothetical protein
VSKSKIKTIMICVLDIRGLINFEFVSEGITVNQTFYVEVSKRLISAVRRKRGELWRDRASIPRHDNAPARSSLRVSQFLAGKGISAVGHPTYSPDLAPADFWLSLEFVKRVSDVEDIKKYVRKGRYIASGF